MRLLRSLIRIALAVVACCALAAALIRQPVLRSIRYEANVRADPATMRRHVVFLTTRPRGASNVRQLDDAAEYIASSFRASGGRVAMQEYDARGRRYRNVIARFGPDAGALLVVGAHYDAFSETRRELPGTDDNASGIAGLLELARLIGRNGVESPVMLVAYSTEEPPFFGSESMGSAVHARSLLQGGTHVRGMICLEMIGYYSGEQRWPNALFELLYPSRGTFIAVAGRWHDRALVRHVKRAIHGAGGIDVYSFLGPRETLDASDHRNYWNAGWRAVLVTDTAYLRNPHYHTIHDTANTLDYGRMARVVDGVFNAVRTNFPPDSR